MVFYLFEYRNSVPAHELPAGLEAYLQAVWEQRPRTSAPFNNDGRRSTRQRYLEFYTDAQGRRRVRARNYVGLIQYGGCQLHLLPKVFYTGERHALLGDQVELTAGTLEAIHAHLYWWLSYSPRLQFPRSVASFAHMPADWFELLTLLFAQHTHELLSRTQYQYYQEVDQELPTLRGRMNFPAYLRNYAAGRRQILPCTFDSFQPDNRFNRLVKDVATQLRARTRLSRNQQLLDDIRFLLADVADQPARLSDCDQVHLSPLFADFEIVLSYCRLFLGQNSPLASTDTHQSVFALLLPTEKIFEDFIAGFLQQHFSTDYAIKPQACDLYLASQEVTSTGVSQPRFNLQHDLLINRRSPVGPPIIIDCKYKTLPHVKGSPDPSSITSADMYQMVSYAVRRGSQHTHLVYPDSLAYPAAGSTQHQLSFTVVDKWSSVPINITAHRLPVVTSVVFLSVADFAASFTAQESFLHDRLTALLNAAS